LSLLYAENYDPRESSVAGPVLPGKFTIFNIIVYYISSWGFLSTSYELFSVSPLSLLSISLYSTQCSA